jgi:CPA2 family monovalent cation:H+ antiporter-2
MAETAGAIISHTFLGDLALVFAIAALTTILARRLNQPSVLGYLLAGMIIGPHIPFPLVADQERVRVFSELGVVLVMFAIGLEFRLERLVRILPTSALVGAIQISSLLWMGYTAGRLLGLSQLESFFAGAVVSISSTIVVSGVFREYPVDRKVSDTVFGVLLTQDLAAIMMLAVLTALASGHGQPASVLLSTVGRLAGVLTVMVVGGYMFVPRLVRKVASLGSRETLLVASIGTCFAFAIGAQMNGYSVALGAFLAGFLVAESGVAKEVIPMVAPVRDIFAAVFFTSVGMMVDPAVIAAHPLTALVLTAVIVAGMFASVSLGSLLVGNDLKTSVTAGMSLGQIGEFSFIMAGVLAASSKDRSVILPSTAIAAAVTTFLTPYMIRRSGSVASLIDRKLPRPLQVFSCLYATWLEGLRERMKADTPWTRARRNTAFILLDAALLLALVAGSGMTMAPVAAFVSAGTGVPQAVILAGLWVAVAGLTVPLFSGIARNSHVLGSSLAWVAIPAQAPGKLDLGYAPRRTLALGLQFLVVGLVVVPVVALGQPFLPTGMGAAAFMALAGVLGIAFWRSTVNLQMHLKAGAMMLVQAMKSGPDGAPGRSPALPELPGLGHLARFHLEPGAAVDRSLSELDLRGQSGASVIAIKRGAEDIVAPSGKVRLAAGDILVVTGTTEALGKASKLLGTGYAEIGNLSVD